MNRPTTNTKARIEEFLRGRDGVELIDCIKHRLKIGHAKKADYLLRGRTIVAELKSLETDTILKVQKILESNGIRLPSGRYQLDRVLDGRGDGDSIRREVIWSIQSSTRKDVRDAERQICDTSVNLDLKADGLLILTNSVPDLSPQIVEHAVRAELSSKRYDAIQSVWFLSESFPPELGKSVVAYASFIENPNARSLTEESKEYLKALNEEWARYRDYPIRSADT